MLGAVVSNRLGILFVCLVALHRCFGMLLDQLGINHTNLITLVMQGVGALLPVTTRRFHADMYLLSSPLFEPTGQLLHPFWVVAEVTLIALPTVQEGNVETLFGNIDTENLMGHLLSPPLSLGHAFATVQPCLSKLTS